MLLLYMSEVFTQHNTGQHPECIQRITRLNQLLQDRGWKQRALCPSWQESTPEALLRVHAECYLRQLEEWCRTGAGRVEADTVVSTGSWPAALSAAGAATDAVQRVVSGSNRRAFCAIRPPGHHALPNAPMGFCLLNNVAIAARAALAEGLQRVLIVDWDVHHGNGTQDTFYEDGRVGFLSIHRSPFYPGTGSAHETGSGQGLGTTLNIPVPFGISRDQFLQKFQRGLESLADRMQPELILISAGFDAHPLDPVGGLCLEEQDFASLTKIVCEVANSHAQGRVVSLLEGGYHLERMPSCAVEHLAALDDSTDAENSNGL